MFITGRMVEIQGPDGPHEARVRGLDEHGCLLAERGNGELCRVKNEGIKLL
jgi:hypothetical protein